MTDPVLDRIKPMAGAENAEAIRASVTAEVRAECADRMYRHAHAEGYSTLNLPALLDDLMKQSGTLEWIERLVAERAGQIR